MIPCAYEIAMLDDIFYQQAYLALHFEQEFQNVGTNINKCGDYELVSELTTVDDVRYTKA